MELQQEPVFNFKGVVVLRARYMPGNELHFAVGVVLPASTRTLDVEVYPLLLPAAFN